MKKLDNAIRLIQDSAIRDALTIISEELERIRQAPKATETLKSVATAINKISGKIT